MPLYEPQDATLGDYPGTGYTYPVDGVPGLSYRGVFFTGDDEADLDGLVGIEDTPYTGTIYMKSRVKQGEATVKVTNVVRVAVGTRADFDVMS